MSALTLSGCQPFSRCSQSRKQVSSRISQSSLPSASYVSKRPTRSSRCLATKEGEREAGATDSVSQPTTDAAGTEEATLPSSSSLRPSEKQTRDVLSEDELRRLAAIKREQSKELGLVEGVLEETRLISWPTPLQAVKDTAIVVALVATSAIVLFGLNTGLTELANLFYGLVAKQK